MKPRHALRLALLVALALFLWIAQHSIGGGAIFLAVAVLWWPLRHEGFGRAVRALLVLIMVLWILHQARWVVYPLAAGILLAYILAPLVGWLEQRGLRRPLASLLALLPIVVLAAATLLLLVPALAQQIQQVIRKLPDVYELLNHRIRPLLERMGASPGSVLPAPESSLVPATGEPTPPVWLEQLTTHAESVLRAALGGLSGVGKGLGKALQWLGVLLLTPVAAYYLLLDWGRLREGLLSWLPRRWHAGVQRLSGDIQTALRVYVRGQGLVAGIEMVLFSILFLLVGLPEPIALGVLCGLLSLIPILGFWLTVLLVALSALTGAHPWATLIRAGLGLIGISVIEGQVLTPRIQGSGLGLHPLAVLLGVLLFGTLFGLPGVLLAVPAMGVIRASLPQIREAWLRSRIYSGVNPPGSGRPVGEEGRAPSGENGS